MTNDNKWMEGAAEEIAQAAYREWERNLPSLPISEQAVITILLKHMPKPETKQQWIPLSERKPTKDDADEVGNIVGRPSATSAETWRWGSIAHGLSPCTHWLPLPKFMPEQQQADDAAFEENWNQRRERNIKLSKIDPLTKDILPEEFFKAGWDAALAHRDRQKEGKD